MDSPSLQIFIIFTTCRANSQEIEFVTRLRFPQSFEILRGAGFKGNFWETISKTTVPIQTYSIWKEAICQNPLTITIVTWNRRFESNSLIIIHSNAVEELPRMVKGKIANFWKILHSARYWTRNVCHNAGWMVFWNGVVHRAGSVAVSEKALSSSS